MSAEGTGQEVSGAAVDRAGNSAIARISLNIDKTAPALAVLQPERDFYTNALKTAVSGSVVEANPVTVSVNGLAARLTGSPPDQAFSVPEVPLGEGPEVLLETTAEDAAGNVGVVELRGRVDRVAPVVQITAPVGGAYLSGSSMHVTGTAADAAAVIVDVNGIPALVSGGSFEVDVPVAEGRFPVRATARDAAGNSGFAEIEVVIDSAPPLITVNEPAPNFVTKAASVRVAGTVADGSPVTLKVAGLLAPMNGGAFSVDVPLSAEGPVTLALEATDAASNRRSHAVKGFVDRTLPALEIVSPAPSSVVGSLPVLVQGLVSDQTEVTVTVDEAPVAITSGVWQVALSSLAEGDHEVTVVATDQAGNATTATRAFKVDLGPPVVTIMSPDPGALTRESSIVVSGTVEDHSNVTVKVNDLPATVSGSPGTFSFTSASLPLSEGDNTLTVVATDQGGRATPAERIVTRDSTPPTLELQTPERVSRGRPGQALASAADDLALERVVFSLSCVSGSESATCTPASQTFTAPPFALPLTVPAGAAAGDTLEVKAEAFDRAGNSTSVTRGVRVSADGVVVGQVLSDTTGLPLADATVALLEGGHPPVPTDERGRYSIPTGDVSASVRVEKEGMTAVEREVTVASGTGTVPLDARLTPLADAVSIASDGGTLTAGPLTVTIPAGAAGSYRLTALSAQGLPGLLPLGFSPLAAFDLRSDAESVGGASLEADGLPGPTAHLVRYSPLLHAWQMEAAGLAPAAGSVTVPLPGPGSFALVAADPGDPPIAIPAAGEPLEGVATVTLPATTTGAGSLDPAVVPPTGGTARGFVSIVSPVAAPSGTVLQAVVAETYTLASGDVASEEKRLQDVVFYRAPGCPPESSLCASFPVTPSRTYPPTELISGKVHLDVLTGRESARGAVGGSDAVTLEAGEARLAVPAGTLAEDSALALEVPPALSSFLPSAGGVLPLSEVVLDFAGLTLASAAELSASAASVAPGDTLLLARVERLDGVPRLTIVALAALEGDRIVSRLHAGLAGITKGGRYVFYRAPSDLGFVAGIVSSSAGPVKAVVEVAAWPFIAIGGTDGSYTLPVPSGAAALTARVAGTSLSGSGSATVIAAETAPLNLLVVGAVTTATVQPANGAVALPTGTQVEIASAAPINAATVTAANVRLLKGADAVPVRLVLSGSGKTLAVIPQQALAFSTDYTLQASGVADVFGGLVSVPATSFRTKDDVPPQYPLDAIGFSFPNADGIVTVSAPADTLPPGTQVLIINSGNGVVLSLTAGNDGSLSGELPASISDQLFITVTDPLGNTISFTRSKFVNATTGETAIGPGGGTVTGEGGVELRIPEGALDKGVSFKVSLVPDTELPALFPNQQLDQLTESVGGFYGGMLKLESSGPASFKKEADLVFPVPDFTKAPADRRPANPKDAFYYVHRRIERCPDDDATCAEAEKLVQFEVIDEAKVEGEGASASVVTASPPFPGLSGALSGMVILLALTWSFEASRPAKPGPGLITGKVFRQKWNPGAATPEYERVADAKVSGEDASGVPLQSKDGGNFATTQADGTFAFWDLRYVGGVVPLVATQGGQTVTGTAFESLGDPVAQRYRAVAKANPTFPAAEPPPIPPQVEVKVLRSSDKKEISGIAVAGAALVIGFKNNTPNTPFTINGARVQGQEFAVRAALPNDPPGLSHMMAETYTPSQPGTYTVETIALPAVGPPVTASATFRVIAEGGGIDNDPVSPPRVITARTLPKANAQGVPVTAFAQIAFTEPVRKIQFPETVSLLEPDGTAVPLKLSGVTAQGAVIENLTPDDAVTSLTIQPLEGFKYDTAYRLLLTEGIEDLDKDAGGNPAPKSLVPYETNFTTFGPSDLGGSAELTGSAGIVVLGDRAYLTRTNGLVSGNLLGFDVSTPGLPVPVGEPVFFAPRPYDIAGEQTEDGHRLIAVATGTTTVSKPASVLFFDATTDDIKWVGASSVTNSAGEGSITRLTMKGDRAYTATKGQGIQIVQVTRNLERLDPLSLQNARTAINTDGTGFGQDAVIQTIPLPKKENGTAYHLSDLEVGEIQGQTLVVAAGEPGIVIADPQTGSILYPQTFPTPLKTPDGSFTLGWGVAVALGRLTDRDVAVVLTRSHLVSIDLSEPSAPRILGHLDVVDPLGGFAPTDVILKGDIALVSAQNGDASDGRVLVVSLAAPARPSVVGTLSGRGGRLALGAGGLSNLLFSTGYSPFGGDNPLGGVRVTIFGAIVMLVDKDKKPLSRIRLPRNYETFVQAILPGADDTVKGVEVSIIDRDGNMRPQTGT
ncbi:MAG TPA: Ig-like domain-containing protein, partial [Vicinamibacteria bacterium]